MVPSAWAWLNGDTETMVKIVKTMPTKRITQQQREKLMAMYMGDESFKDRLCHAVKVLAVS